MPITTYEVELDVSSSRLWDALKDFAVVLPKACPHMYASIEDVPSPEGIIRHIKHGNVLPNGEDLYVKEKVILVDNASMTMGSEQLEGPHLGHGYTKWFTFIKIAPFGDNKSKAIATFDYEGGTAEGISGCQQGFESVLKGLATYLTTHDQSPNSFHPLSS